MTSSNINKYIMCGKGAGDSIPGSFAVMEVRE